MNRAAAADEIRRAQLYRYALPLRHPLPLRGDPVHVRQGFLLCVTGSSGAMGWGDIAPLPGFSREELLQAEKDARGLCRRLPGWPLTAEQILSEPRRSPWALSWPSVRFGAESACLDLLAGVSGLPISRVLGVPDIESVPVNALVPAEATGEDVERLLAEGYDRLKVKVGRALPEEDRSMVEALVSRLRGRARLRLDANRAWSLPEAVRFVAGLPWQDIEYIEEPLREPRQLAEFARSTGAPLALDETLVEAERAAEEIGSAPARPADEDPVILPAPWKAPDGEGSHSTLPPTRRKPPALDLSGFQAVVMKPTLIGGIGRCMSILHQAKDSGVVPVISSSFESGVGTQMLAALAAAAADTACGLDPYRWLAEDLLADPLRLVRGRLWFNCRASGPARVKVQYLQELADDDNTVSP